MQKLTWFSFLKTPFFLIPLFCVLLEGILSYQKVPAYLLPLPSAIIKQFSIDKPLLWEHSLSSFTLLFTGILLAIVLSLALLWLCSLWPRLDQILMPIVIMGQAIPTVALSPLLLIYFGLDSGPKLVFVALFSFFPIFLYGNDKRIQLETHWQHLRLNLEKTRHSFFWEIELGLLLPSMFTGLKIALTYSLGTVIFVEWLGGRKGLGIFLARAVSSFDNSRVLMLAIYISVLAILLVQGTQWLQSKLLFWIPKQSYTKHKSIKKD